MAKRKAVPMASGTEDEPVAIDPDNDDDDDDEFAEALRESSPTSDSPAVSSSPVVPASPTVPEVIVPSADGSTTEIPATITPTEGTTVPTAINPDTWPDPTKGTVTDPDALRRHGLGPEAEVSAPVAQAPETTPEVEPIPTMAEATAPPPVKQQAWQCWRDRRASMDCPVFYSNDHRANPPKPPKCPKCGSEKVLAVEVPPQ